MKKNENGIYFFAAVGVAIAVFMCVGIILFNYSDNVKKELYETSSRNLNEVYKQVSEKFLQITGQQWKLLGMTGDFINEADGNEEDIRSFLNEWKNEWHYTEFYFVDDDCNYLSSAGRRGYLELGNTWKSLVINRESVIVDGSNPGSDEVMFFAIPVDPAYINGFSYSSIAVSYNTDSINRELGIKAFAKDTSSYIVYANGDIVLKSEGSMDTGGNIFYHLKNVDFYGKSGYRQASEFRIRYHGLTEDEDASFFLCRELIPGYLDGITGEYAPPQGYYVDEQEAEAFDKTFYYKEKKKLPGQLF